jgi:predicted 3-demethylubiquinone-9 3-methyltransferase (glyoxalase superfamily)
MSTSKIAPCLWFNGEAEDAANFYVSLFPDSRIDRISRYDGETRFPVPFPKGTALMVEFTLSGQRFQALNGGPQYRHSEAMSLSVSCRDAKEVDHYWSGLTANGGSEGPCGWLKDRFGVSWQVVPEGLGTLLSDPDPRRVDRALQAMFKMKKLDLAAMRAAADQTLNLK